MNRKLTAVIGVSCATILAAHAAYWIYQSGKIKASMGIAANQISQELGRKNSEFFFGSSSISGYPFKFEVSLNEPKFIRTGGGETMEVSSPSDPLVVTSNLIGNKYSIKIPSTLNIKKTADEHEQNYTVNFQNKNPNISVSLANDFIISKDGDASLPERIRKSLRKLSYSDAGYVITDDDSSQNVGSASSNRVFITRNINKANTYSTSYDLKIADLNGQALFSNNEGTDTDEQTDISENQQEQGLWPVTIALDISSMDSKDKDGKSNSVEFVVRNADVKANSFAVSIKGKVRADGNDIFPYGDMSIKLNNYAQFVDYFQEAASNAMSESRLPLFHIKSEKTVDFKNVLYSISSEKSNEDKDILLTLSREQGKSLFIGQKGIMEVIDLLKASAVDSPIQQKSTNVTEQKTNPSNSVVETAPAAGTAE